MTDEMNKKPDEPISPTDENEANDVVFEDTNEDGEPNLQLGMKQLKERLKKAEIERAEYLAGWKRAQADLANGRKRDEEDKKQFVKYVNEGLISELLPVLDSFTMAFSNKEAWEKVDKNWRQGVEYIYNQLVSILEQNNLKVLYPKGEKFDPNKHISVEAVPVTDKAQDDVVIEVIQNGYELSGKVIREAKVKVGEFKG